MSAIGNNKMTDILVREIVRKKLFRAFKFISEDDLYYKGYIARFVMNELGRSAKEERDSTMKFWARHKKTVRKAVDSKRSTTAMAVKREVISK